MVHDEGKSAERNATEDGACLSLPLVMGLYGVVIAGIIIDHTYFRGKGKPQLDLLSFLLRLPTSRMYPPVKKEPGHKIFKQLPIKKIQKCPAGWVLLGGLKLIEVIIEL